MKYVVVLGSTGAVGRQALEIVRAFLDRLQVVGLAGHGNASLLAQQADEFGADCVWCSPNAAGTADGRLVAKKSASPETMAALPEVDIVVNATVGAEAGLPSTLAAIKAGKTVALANQEVLVMSGALLMEATRQHSATIIPVDSALSAIWQCLQGEPKDVRRLILTAAPPSDSSRVPEWPMGRKAQVDVLTLMNIGMQAIEAHWLFGAPLAQIEIISHPQSVVRAMVEFADGSIKAVFGHPNPLSSLQYALSYPERWPNPDLPPLDLLKVGKLTFNQLDLSQYPCLELAVQAGERGGTAPAVLNAANEMAVTAFFAQQISLPEIPTMIASALAAHRPIQDPTIDDLRAADSWARKQIAGQLGFSR